jgi:hypothetical protein
VTAVLAAVDRRDQAADHTHHRDAVHDGDRTTEENRWPA